MEASMLEAGRYLAADAARLVGVPGDRIGQWARWGHIRASVSAAEPHVYAWGDVAEALAVHVLTDGGVALPVIRAVVDALDRPWPLTTSGVHLVDGVVAVERAGGLEDVFGRQGVLASPADAPRSRAAARAAAARAAAARAATGPTVGAIPMPERRYGADRPGEEVAGVEVWVTVGAALRLARGGWVASDAVTVDPGRAGGRPCARRTRLAVADLAADPDAQLDLDSSLRDAALAWWAASEPASGPQRRPEAPPVAKAAARGETSRALVLDAGLAPALVGELRARGREAYGIPGAPTDAEVAALDGVVVTTDPATWAACARAALVPPGPPGRDLVHRHAHELSALRGRRRLR